MKNVREIVGALTQARIQMIAAQALLQAEVENMATSSDLRGLDEDGEKELAALKMDVQKLDRSAAVVCDVRDRILKSLEKPKGEQEKA